MWRVTAKDSTAPSPIDPVLTVQPDHCYIFFSLKNTFKNYFINYHNIIHLSLVRRTRETLKTPHHVIYWLTNLGKYINTATVIPATKDISIGVLASLAGLIHHALHQRSLKIPPWKSPSAALIIWFINALNENGRSSSKHVDIKI